MQQPWHQLYPGRGLIPCFQLITIMKCVKGVWQALEAANLLEVDMPVWQDFVVALARFLRSLHRYTSSFNSNHCGLLILAHCLTWQSEALLLGPCTGAVLLTAAAPVFGIFSR